jgi:hypothetical protein
VRPHDMGGYRCTYGGRVMVTRITLLLYGMVYAGTRTLYYKTQPSFEEIMKRLKEYLGKLKFQLLTAVTIYLLQFDKMSFII